MICVGIDISKARFDCALFIEKGCQSKSFSNDNKGFKALCKWLTAWDKAQERVFCMEATGVYGVALAQYLHQSNEKVIVANPIKTNAFTKMDMYRMYGQNNYSCVICTSAIHGGRMPILHRYMDVTY